MWNKLIANVKHLISSHRPVIHTVIAAAVGGGIGVIEQALTTGAGLDHATYIAAGRAALAAALAYIGKIILAGSSQQPPATPDGK